MNRRRKEKIERKEEKRDKSWMKGGMKIERFLKKLIKLWKKMKGDKKWIKKKKNRK